jgi:hypothetical protein
MNVEIETKLRISLSGPKRKVLQRKKPGGKWKAIQKILLYLFRFSVPLIVHWMAS